MRTPHALALALVFPLTVFARVDPSLSDVVTARSLLAPESWSRVVRIENSNATSEYPRSFHALVFELADILWFYAGVNGTQSLSLFRGRLAEDKADLGPLLADIDPGFVRWSVVPEEKVARTRPSRQAPNACFLESVAAWRALVARGESPDSAMLLSFYAQERGRVQGHTILTYLREGALHVLDPQDPRRMEPLPARLAADPLELARRVAGMRVDKARFLPLAPVLADDRPTWAGAAEPAPAVRTAS